MIDRKWIIMAGCAILYVTAFIMFGPVIKIILLVGAIGYGVYRFS